MRPLKPSLNLLGGLVLWRACSESKLQKNNKACLLSETEEYQGIVINIECRAK
jgi:hypothetical protein